MHLPFLVVPCLYLRYVLGKGLVVLQLIQAIYLRKKYISEKFRYKEVCISGTLPV